MRRQLERDIEAAIEARFKMPRLIAKLAGVLRADLYHGPLYTDGRGNVLAFGDEGAHQFDFPRASRIVRRWLEANVSACYFDVQAGMVCDALPEAEEIEGEIFEPDYSDFYELDARDVWRHLLGSELAETLR